VPRKKKKLAWENSDGRIGAMRHIVTGNQVFHSGILFQLLYRIRQSDAPVRDSKFSAEVSNFLEVTGLKPTRTSIQSPWQNGRTPVIQPTGGAPAIDSPRCRNRRGDEGRLLIPLIDPFQSFSGPY
jgi:hypothetical protein